MEFYSGTLADALEKNLDEKKMFSAKQVSLFLVYLWPCFQVLNYAYQIAKGLNYLHTLPEPIIHRDLKVQPLFYSSFFPEC